MRRNTLGMGLVWLAVGLAGGLVLAFFWPNTPLHAVATDKVESFSIATGSVDEFSEAVYFLDHLTGDLNAAVIGRAPRGGSYMLTGIYSTNVMKDLNIDAGKSPRFLMVTGNSDLARGGRGALMPSRAVLYVAEVATGRAAAYAIPYNLTAHNQGQVVKTPLMTVIAFPFRKVTPGAVAGKAKDE